SSTRPLTIRQFRLPESEPGTEICHSAKYLIETCHYDLGTAYPLPLDHENESSQSSGKTERIGVTGRRHDGVLRRADRWPRVAAPTLLLVPRSSGGGAGRGACTPPAPPSPARGPSGSARTPPAHPRW